MLAVIARNCLPGRHSSIFLSLPLPSVVILNAIAVNEQRAPLRSDGLSGAEVWQSLPPATKNIREYSRQLVELPAVLRTHEIAASPSRTLSAAGRPGKLFRTRPCEKTGGCAPQKPLQVATCMTPAADSSLCLRLTKELCSAFSLCAKLISHVASSMHLAVLLQPQPYGPLGTAARWIAVPECRHPFANGRCSGGPVLT